MKHASVVVVLVHGVPVVPDMIVATVWRHNAASGLCESMNWSFLATTNFGVWRSQIVIVSNFSIWTISETTS